LSAPKICMPRAISHFPVGGWTMKEPSNPRPEKSPRAKAASDPSAQVPSYPRWARE